MRFLLIILAGLSITPVLKPTLNYGDTLKVDGTVQVWDGGYECFCARPDAGSCLVPIEDGGMGQAPQGSTLPPSATGKGCFVKACREPNGRQGSSWPKACN